MKNQFDELAKGLAQTATRRAALKKIGVGLVGTALAAIGLGNAAAAPRDKYTCCYGYSPSGLGYFLVCAPPGVSCQSLNYGIIISEKPVSDCKLCKNVK